MIQSMENDKYFNRRFNFASIKYKDLVLLSTEEIHLEGKNDLKKVYRTMEDFHTLLKSPKVALAFVQEAIFHSKDKNKNVKFTLDSKKCDFIRQSANNWGVARIYCYFISALA